MNSKLNDKNFDTKAFRFRDRQAGISVIYDPVTDKYTYNAYCLETKLLKELFTCEYDYLEDALHVINEEFGSWELTDMAPDDKQGCKSCVAKK